MTDDKIAEIHRRHEFAGTHMRPAEFYWTIPGWIAHIDRAFLLAEVERLRASLKPFAQLYLWPDDLGEDMATLLRAEADWCEATNEDADSDVFIKRKYIRAARAALEAKP